MRSYKEIGLVKQLKLRLNSWQGIGALLAGAAMLWVGLALAMVLAFLAGIALLRSRVRNFCTRTPARRGPVTIEGHFTEIRR